MAALTEIRDLLAQQFVVVAAVDNVAVQAIFGNWGMLIHEGTAFFGVALVTEFVDGIGLQALFAHGSMRIMAIAAGNLAFLDGMVGLSARFGLDIFVAGEAKLSLGHLQILGQAGVAGVAVVAGKTGGEMLAGFPEGHRLGSAMTGEALGGFFLRGSFFVEGKGAGSLAAALFHVGSQFGAMTGDADIGDASFGVARFHESGELVGMAVFTSFAAGVAGRLGAVDGHPCAEQGDHPRDQGKH